MRAFLHRSWQPYFDLQSETAKIRSVEGKKEPGLSRAFF